VFHKDHSWLRNCTSIGFKYLYPRFRIAIDQLGNSLKSKLVVGVSNDVRERASSSSDTGSPLRSVARLRTRSIRPQHTRSSNEIKAYAVARLKYDSSPLGSFETLHVGLDGIATNTEIVYERTGQFVGLHSTDQSRLIVGNGDLRIWTTALEGSVTLPTNEHVACFGSQWIQPGPFRPAELLPGNYPLFVGIPMASNAAAACLANLGHDNEICLFWRALFVKHNASRSALKFVASERKSLASHGIRAV